MSVRSFFGRESSVLAIRFPTAFALGGGPREQGLAVAVTQFVPAIGLQNWRKEQGVPGQQPVAHPAAATVAEVGGIRSNGLDVREHGQLPRHWLGHRGIQRAEFRFRPGASTSENLDRRGDLFSCVGRKLRGADESRIGRVGCIGSNCQL